MKHSVIRHFGHGAGDVPMPCAISRPARKNWPVHPSFVILVLSVSLFILFKTTIDNKKFFKQSETIIILPNKPEIPEPTVEEKIPLIKVLKDAVKKSVEKKQIELKKITPKKTEVPKPKPTPLIPRKIEPKKLTSKKIIPETIQQKKIIPKELKPLLKKPKVPEPRTVQRINTKEIQRNKPVPHKINQEKKLTVKKETIPDLIENRTPEPKKIETQKMNTSPKLTAKTEARQTIKAAPKPNNTFSPVTTGLSVPVASVKALPEKQPVIRSNTKMQVHTGPEPKLSQRGPAPAASLARQESRPKIPVSQVIPKTHSVPVPSIVPVLKNTKSIDEDEYVIIESNVLEYSARVKNLKVAIYEKAKRMSHEKSPYEYTVKGYQCTVIIDKSGIIRIKFDPANAPFEVVSALERILPSKP